MLRRPSDFVNKKIKENVA